jgi:hypothetical protein
VKRVRAARRSGEEVENLSPKDEEPEGEQGEEREEGEEEREGGEGGRAVCREDSSSFRQWLRTNLSTKVIFWTLEISRDISDVTEEVEEWRGERRGLIGEISGEEEEEEGEEGEEGEGVSSSRGGGIWTMGRMAARMAMEAMTGEGRRARE